jgi:tetratricopeptide (TPR) repeat protein
LKAVSYVVTLILLFSTCSMAHAGNGDIEALLNQADEKTKSWDFEDAIATYDKVLETENAIFSQNKAEISDYDFKGRALIGRGRAEARLKNFDEALVAMKEAETVYDSALTLHPGNVVMETGKAISATRLGIIDAQVKLSESAFEGITRGVKALDLILKEKPTEFDLLSLRARAIQSQASFLVSRKDYPKAIEIFKEACSSSDKVLRLRPESADDYITKSYSSLMLNTLLVEHEGANLRIFRETLKTAELAAKYAPENSEAYRMQGLILTMMARLQAKKDDGASQSSTKFFKEAIVAFDKALSLPHCSDDVEALKSRVEVSLHYKPKTVNQVMNEIKERLSEPEKSP